MTQPVYDPAVLLRFLDDVEPLGLPVLVGLLPLASFRNAEFLHNEFRACRSRRMCASGCGRRERRRGAQGRGRDRTGDA